MEKSYLLSSCPAVWHLCSSRTSQRSVCKFLIYHWHEVSTSRTICMPRNHLSCPWDCSPPHSPFPCWGVKLSLINYIFKCGACYMKESRTSIVSHCGTLSRTSGIQIWLKLLCAPKKNTQRIQIHMQHNGVGPRSISFHAKRINECVIDTREDNAAYA